MDGPSPASPPRPTAAAFLHPFLFAAYPILYVYSVHVHVLSLSDVLVFLGGTWAVLAIVLICLFKATRVAGRAAGVLSGLFVILFCFAPLAVGARSIPEIGFLFWSPEAVLALWGVCSLTVMFLLWRWGGRPGATRFLNVVGGALLAMNVVSIVSGISSTTQPSDTWPRLVEQPKAARSRPDIFYIVLDGYARADTLQRVFGYDNGPFLEQLRRLGFYVADRSHSNYVQTQLSLTSSLNAGYLPEVLPEFSPQSDDRTRLDALIDQNSVAGYLRSQGYWYVGIGTGFPAFRFYMADARFTGSETVPRIGSLLLDLTPWGGTRPAQRVAAVKKRAAITDAFATAARLAVKGGRPRFVFMHVLAPHPPFVFKADGSDRQPRVVVNGLWDGSHFFSTGGTMEEYQDGYRNQLEYISRAVLDLVHTIVRENPEAVIVLQGDHGSKSHLDQESLRKTDVREAFGILNAYRVPPSVRSRLYPAITPVNSFRAILSGVFGENLPALPDASYYSGWQYPYRLTEVTNILKRTEP